MDTANTCKFLNEAGIPAKKVHKLNEGRPNCVDIIMNREVDIVLNTPSGKNGSNDGAAIRKTAIKVGINYITTMAAAKASIEGIKAMQAGAATIKSLQQFHAEIE